MIYVLIIQNLLSIIFSISRFDGCVIFYWIDFIKKKLEVVIHRMVGGVVNKLWYVM